MNSILESIQMLVYHIICSGLYLEQCYKKLFGTYITTWNLRDWVPYGRILTEKFPNNFLDKTEGRVYMHMDVINLSSINI